MNGFSKRFAAAVEAARKRVRLVELPDEIEVEGTDLGTMQVVNHDLSVGARAVRQLINRWPR